MRFAFTRTSGLFGPNWPGKSFHGHLDDHPWTIPANLAIAVKDDFIYAAVKIDDDVLIVAKDMLDYCLDAFGYRGKAYEIVDEFKGEVLEGQKCVHPLIQRNSLLILAPFVTLEAGTGAVHIAPGHGQEDYEIGLEYGLDNYAPVDDAVSSRRTSNISPDNSYLTPTTASFRN